MTKLNWTRLNAGVYYAKAPQGAPKPGVGYLINRLLYSGPIKWELCAVAPSGAQTSLDTFATLAEAKTVGGDLASWGIDS